MTCDAVYTVMNRVLLVVSAEAGLALRGYLECISKADKTAARESVFHCDETRRREPGGVMKELSLGEEQ
jgi:hypothetical protein